MDDRLRQAPIGVIEVSAEGVVTAVNDAARDLIDADDDVTGLPVEESFPRSVEDSLLDAVRGDAVADTEFEEYYPDHERWLAVSVVPAGDGATVYLEDATERRRHERTVQALEQDRERAAVVDAVLSEVLVELVGAASLEEIAETVCRELGGTERYEFAWVGEREIGGSGLTVSAVAGETGETFTAVREALDGQAATPEERAVETSRLQAAQPLPDDSAVPEAVRRAGFADGVQSALAIPLAYGSNVHGVVGVYADGTEAFSDRERDSFEMLGEVAGFAVTAARNRNLLLSDSVTEVTLDVGGDSALAALSDELGAEFALEGVVPHGDDALLCFVAAGGHDAETLRRVADGVDGIAGVRVVDGSDSDSGSGGTAEVEVRGATPLLAVSSLGGTLRRASFENGTGRVVVDLPPDEDARRVVNAVGREYDAELVAKRERERSVTTTREFRDELDDRLTERQRTVLRTAYLADYFESPRGSTAEEVAASLDITGPTLLHHLRAGQRKLFDVYFAEDAPTRD
jgi:DNA-binding CsgD family transcriptional regulator